MGDFDRHLEDEAELDIFANTEDENHVERKLVHALVDMRFDSNLTTKKLAKLAGIDYKLLQLIESGVKSPTVAMLLMIADVCGKTLHIDFTD